MVVRGKYLLSLNCWTYKGMFWNTTLHIRCFVNYYTKLCISQRAYIEVRKVTLRKKSILLRYISPFFLSRNSLIIISSEQKVRYSLRPRLSRRLPIDQSFRITYRRLALFIRRLHVNSVTQAMIRSANCYTSLSWTRWCKRTFTLRGQGEKHTYVPRDI